MSLKFKKIAAGSRCQNRAYIVLLGLTGAGKSTTLNFLFGGEEITNKTESYASATSQILEYSVNVPTQSFGDCELRLIDTPGFGDTRQKPLERDAKLMATFDAYLQGHEDLSLRYPTAVLLVVKYNDDRIDGETSHFIQMLKALESLLIHNKLMDKGSDKLNSCNLIVVLTHTMSEESENLREDPSPKIKLIEGLVKTFTSIPTPLQVIMAENKPELHKLPQLNGYHKLPCGQYYPLNLFNKIQSIAIKSDDPAGETILRSAFRNPKALGKKELIKVTELLPAEDQSVQEIFSVLHHARFHTAETPISKLLKEHWESLDERLTRPYFNTLQIAQSTFQKLGISEVSQIPKTQNETLNLLAELPMNPPLAQVLDKLGVCPPELPNKTLGVGHFFSFSGDTILPVTPFVMHEQSFECTEIGFRAPNCVKAHTVGESETVVAVYTTSLLNQKERMKTLNVSGEIAPERFEGEAKPGHYVINGKDLIHKLTGIREHREYSVTLTRRPKLSVPFRSAVHQLPPYSDKDEVCKDKWRKFFEAYGTHVVKSVFAGGYIEITAVRNTEVTRVSSSTQILNVIKELLWKMGSKLPPNLENLPEDWDFSVNFIGGDPNLIRPRLNLMFKEHGIEFYKAWLASLRTHPALLQSDMKLENVILHVQEINAEQAEQIDRAMKNLTGVTGFAKSPEPIKREEIKAPQKQPWYHRLKHIFSTSKNARYNIKEML